ncbi:MAG TPA: NUDIX hydrolase [Anaerolineales bacterium]|nr:NUDIX hydrolase [Anaerolineales bacterium]
MTFELVSSETTYHGKVFNVRRDKLRMPDGNLTELDIVDHPGAVTLIPVDAQGHVCLVRQYRHATREELLELPAGAMGQAETPEACARREVREEIGMSAGRLEKIGEFYLAPGYSTEYMYVFLATELSPDPLQPDEDEFLSVESIPLEQLLRMAESGKIMDSKSLAALFLARPYLESLS